MFKVIALLAVVGVASAGNIALGYSHLGYGAPLVASPVLSHQFAADSAALTRNVGIVANGAFNGAVRDAHNLNTAIATNANGAAIAQARDQANLNAQAHTQDVINANGAFRNAVSQQNQAAIQNIQVANQHAVARAYNGAIPALAYGASPALAYGAAPALAYGAYGLY